jgi:hypothetical protein
MFITSAPPSGKMKFEGEDFSPLKPENLLEKLKINGAR